MKKRRRTTFLAKANDLVISHCRCASEAALIAFPPQMDCPWCGCGWLFTCMTCRKAFTFARGVEVDASLEDLAREDLSSGLYRGKRVPKEAVENWVAYMTLALREVRTEGEYVILDSVILSTEQTQFRGEGVYARHDLPFLPQVRARKDHAALDQSIGLESYWRERRVQNGD